MGPSLRNPQRIHCAPHRHYLVPGGRSPAAGIGPKSQATCHAHRWTQPPLVSTPYATRREATRPYVRFLSVGSCPGPEIRSGQWPLRCMSFLKFRYLLRNVNLSEFAAWIATEVAVDFSRHTASACRLNWPEEEVLSHRALELLAVRMVPQVALAPGVVTPHRLGHVLLCKVSAPRQHNQHLDISAAPANWRAAAQSSCRVWGRMLAVTWQDCCQIWPLPTR